MRRLMISYVMGMGIIMTSLIWNVRPAFADFINVDSLMVNADESSVKLPLKAEVKKSTQDDVIHEYFRLYSSVSILTRLSLEENHLGETEVKFGHIMLHERPFPCVDGQTEIPECHTKLIDDAVLKTRHQQGKIFYDVQSTIDGKTIHTSGSFTLLPGDVGIIPYLKYPDGSFYVITLSIGD